MAEQVKGSRQDSLELYKEVPLEVPFSLHVFLSYVCDFKCCYCVHSLSEPDFSNLLGRKRVMSLDVFKTAIDGVKKFKNKLKVINFAGHGEPLMNKNLPEMIAYASKRNVAERIELVTNANGMTYEKSDALIAAGLTSLRVSIQGLSSKKYREISGVDINFEKLLAQIKYFYKNKGCCKVYIKLIDQGLEGSENEFFNIFGDYCDRIAIENMVPTASLIKYDLIKENYEKSQHGFEIKEIKVCPMPFYMMILDPDGNVFPCCATEFPIMLGNVADEPLYDIWNSIRIRDFWRSQLKNGRKSNEICARCSNPDYGIQPGDILDDHIFEILSKMCT